MKKLIVCITFLLLVAAYVVVSSSAASELKAPNNFKENFEDGYLLFDDGVGVIHLRQSGSTAETDYAPGIQSSGGKFYARLSVQPANNINGDQFNGTCVPGDATGNNSFSCGGPFTEWGLPYGGLDGAFDTGIPIKEAALTSIDIYLDTAFAATARASGGSKDYRFDWDSDLLDIQGNFLQDYIFNVATGLDTDKCDLTNNNMPTSGGFYVIEASTNSQRSGANAHNLDPTKPQACISQSGWYTFQHTFRPDSQNNLEVDMVILDSHNDVVASWQLHPTCMGTQVNNNLCTNGAPLPFSVVGSNFLGWFPDQEINNLAIDNIQRKPR